MFPQLVFPESMSTVLACQFPFLMVVLYVSAHVIFSREGLVAGGAFDAGSGWLGMVVARIGHIHASRKVSLI